MYTVQCTVYSTLCSTCDWQEHGRDAVRVEGYLQSFRYFEPFRAEIRARFAFGEQVIAAAASNIERALRTSAPLCCTSHFWFTHTTWASSIS